MTIVRIVWDLNERERLTDIIKDSIFLNKKFKSIAVSIKTGSQKKF